MVAQNLILLSAIIIGALVGLVLQKGRGCTNTAFRNLFLIKNIEMFLMIVVVVCIEILGYYFLSIVLLRGNFSYNPIIFSFIVTPLGGLIFGIGTVFAGGCAGGTCYRMGEGSLAAVLAFLGFASGIALIEFTPIGIYVNQLRTATLWIINGQTPSLHQFIPFWVINVTAIITLVFVIFYYYYKKQNNELQMRHLLPKWNPITTGIFLGILGILARYFSTLSGREFGLSTTDGIAELFQFVIFFQPIGWAGLMIFGLILGSLISATLGKEFKISIPSKIEFFRFYGGGILLGIGAIIGYGCNFGHIFGGIPELGISSFVALFFMMIGNGLASQFYYFRLSNELPLSTPI